MAVEELIPPTVCDTPARIISFIHDSHRRSYGGLVLTDLEGNPLRLRLVRVQDGYYTHHEIQVVA